MPAPATQQSRLVLADRPFSPLDLPGVIRWFDFSSITGLVADDPIATVTDLARSGGHLTQGTGSKRFAYKPGLYNGLAAGRGDGVDDFMSVVNLTLPTFFTLFVVGKFLTGNPGAMFVEHGPTANSNPGVYFNGANGNSWKVNRGGSTHEATGISNWMTAALGIAEFVYDGAGLYALNGTAQANGVITGTALGNSNVTDTLYVGARAGTSLFTSGDWCEIVLAAGALDAGLRSKTRRYLGAKWGPAVT